MTNTDQMIAAIADFYSRPFHELPMAERWLIARTIKRDDGHHSVWTTEAGIAAAEQIDKLVAALDLEAAAALYRAHIIDATGAAERYEAVRGLK